MLFILFYLVIYCTQCYQIFSDRKTLIKHQIEIHDRSLKKNNNDNNNLEEKMIPFYFCDSDNCNKSFLCQSKLNRHKRLNHCKTLKCTFCDKKFSNHWDLKMHKRTHLKEKVEKCNFCQMAFSNPCTLKKHIQFVHKTIDGINLKEYQCKKCHKKFTRKESLMRHFEKIHNHKKENQKLFECNICFKQFKYKYNMNRHNKVFH